MKHPVLMMNRDVVVQPGSPLRVLVSAAITALVLCNAGTAAADGAPVQYPFIGDFVQLGQDVQIKIGIAQSPCSIDRRGEGYDWQPADLVDGCCAITHSTQVVCWDFLYDPAECEENPGMYQDCNGDDYAECCGECFTKNYYHVIDQCVPPGETEYRLTADCSQAGTCEGAFLVEDSGDPCLEVGADADSDADGGDNFDDDVRDADCGCGTIGNADRGRTLGAFALIMLAIGFGALTVSRRLR
jgi:hypothetical protein